MKKKILNIIFSFFLLVSIATQIFGQANYYVRRFERMPDSISVRAAQHQLIAFHYPDVRNLGKGGTVIADETKYNSMNFNPAHLAYQRKTDGSARLVANIPEETIRMYRFIDTHESDFSKGEMINNLVEGIKSFLIDEASFDTRKFAYSNILKALEYPQEILRSVVGDIDNPQKHALNAFGSANYQLGNLGFSLSGYGETIARADLGPVFEALTRVQLPENFEDALQIEQTLSELKSLLEFAVDRETGAVDPRILPAVYTFTYLDLVGSVGYGMFVYNNLSLGVNVKIINRRLSAKRINATKFSNFVEEALADFNTSVTGLTFDIGGHYKFQNGGSFGFSILNLLPSKSISSEYELNFRNAILEKDLEDDGSPIINSEGDTALVSYIRPISILGPIKFSFPVTTNVGGYYPFSEEFDLSFDMLDIFAQDTRFDKYWDRFRFGSEYRYSILHEKITLAVRVGFSNRRPTIGTGINLYDFIGLDAAYFYDSLIKSNVASFQMSFSW